jgi:hypothetical protein
MPATCLAVANSCRVIQVAFVEFVEALLAYIHNQPSPASLPTGL